MFLNHLGLVYRRRGMLGFAIQTYERGLTLLERADPAHPFRWFLKMNMALAFLHRDETERARELLEAVLAVPESVFQNWQWALARLTHALYAIQVQDWPLLEALTDHLESRFDTLALRSQMHVRIYQTHLLLARGETDRAIGLLREVLGQSQESAPLGDMVPEAARDLAVALRTGGHLDEALEHARLAARTGRRADALEWAGGLRVAGECLADMGRHGEARRSFAEALAVLDSTEFLAERRRVRSAMERAGVGHGLRRCDRSPARDTKLVRLPLRDGRVFITRANGLAAAIRQAAQSRLPVLLEGETGTGKELVAHLVHELGPVASRPFVVVDCATLAESLAEAELFGASRGAYTGAIADRQGLIAAADGGTLFLDELPEFSLPLQAKLLRVLQEGTYRRVGEAVPRRIRARVIAATNRDVEWLLARGLLKPDLYYRLNGHRLRLHPLRGRPEDIADLAAEIARDEGFEGLTEDALLRLRARVWPGNVRQLQMVIRVAASEHRGETWLNESALRLEDHGDRTARDAGSLKSRRLEAERETLSRALESHGGNRAAVARALSMSRQGLYKALRRVGLS